MRVRFGLAMLVLGLMQSFSTFSQTSKFKITDFYFQVGSANYNYLRLPYARFSSAFPENENLQRDDLTTWPSRLSRRSGFLLNNIELGVGYQSSKAPIGNFIGEYSI